MINKQLFTEMPIIDYVFPLYVENINVIYGSANLGQKQILHSTAIRKATIYISSLL
jgi:hypothetical protein